MSIGFRGLWEYLPKKAEITYINVNLISPNPNQPRRRFADEQLVELAGSIKEHGVLQPINVRIHNSRYELVSGERRLRAAKIAGLSEVPSIIIDVDERQSAVLALIENLQREDLNYLEEAESFQSLLTASAMTQEQLARQLGKSQSMVANKLRLLKLSPFIKSSLIENNLTERHARALLKLDDEGARKEVLDRVIKNSLTVKRTEQLIEKMLSDIQTAKRIRNVRPYIKDLRIFTNTINDAVSIMQRSGVKTVCEIEEHRKGCLIRIAVDY